MADDTDDTDNADNVDHKRAKFDQITAELADRLPGIWRRLHTNLIECGFEQFEAMTLVKTFILSQCPFGIRGSD